MCGIFGIISTQPFSSFAKSCKTLVRHSEQRGRDSSGFLFLENLNYKVIKSDCSIGKLHKSLGKKELKVFLGHSRLVTNGMNDNQPVTQNSSVVFHNGIIVNTEEIWSKISQKRSLTIDSEIISALFKELSEEETEIQDIPKKILSICEGVISCAVALPLIGKICLFSNNGSLFTGKLQGSTIYASESFPLNKLGCDEIKQVFDPVIIDIPKSNNGAINESNLIANHKLNLVPSLSLNHQEEKLLQYNSHDLVRCSKCILPETMPYISFDHEGVCNYCNNYVPRNVPRKIEELVKLVRPYRRTEGNDCIVPFSGGRDSCYAMHLAVTELNLKPVAYTYDWGMVTDLARRNISRMCAQLGVENIIIADDIKKKRLNIKKNLIAWLKSPNLGMVSILTAGDKHFFNFVEKVKQQTNINLNLWGVCPLEITHFKAGFLGIPPDFEEKLVYSSGAFKQTRYQFLRLKAMLQSLGYFNISLWDTLSGEYYRSFKKKKDYYHLYDFWKWEEKAIENTLNLYDWEKAQDTNSTWRIGDGTAAFYNYIYYTMAGFTEHDTFRSNQIREGDLSRQEAIELVEDENKPRYQNIKWYLDTIGINFKETINRINEFRL
jgi:DNA-binding ferritin-like protein (Dps family)